MDINIRIAGEAGQGVQTTGGLLVHVFANMGLHVFSQQSYMSRIRGGLNWYDVRIADSELFSGREKTDLLVALVPEALDALREDVAEGGTILLDTEEGQDVVALPFTKTAKKVAESAVMANSVAAGAVLTVLGYDAEKLCDYLSVEFKKKGQEVVEKNVQCARKGVELAADHAGSMEAPEPGDAPATVYSGTEGVGIAAARAGIKLVCSYPMTPSTGVLTYLAKAADEFGIVVEQAEDEIAAVNMICGATYAGVPAMTTTSGGGFALMCEGLSLAGIMELPILIMDSQRPGPATGLPTRTAQQDLQFVLYAGHGEFPRAVFAPGTPGQAYEITRRAVETAHRFQTPVILLIDQYLADLQRNMPELDKTYDPIDRCVETSPPPDYFRYAVTDNGVSPRAIPAHGAFVILDSDEHYDNGHITEDLDVRMAQQDKRMRKLNGMIAEALPPELYGPEDAETLLIAWGSTYGPCREAVDILNADGRSAAMLHFAQVWPLKVGAIQAVVGERKRVIAVEGNATGQFASILREGGVLGECEKILRYDGMPFTGQEIAERAQT
ncbi:MAG: 2-oxoacid:acceptor oxidoreductase subunit alpha [Planctomycetes bacterium]|nr:2-oxoacid:acceptor oxidoreductase subunit alpha [Planctomycetota bacterium]